MGISGRIAVGLVGLVAVAAWIAPAWASSTSSDAAIAHAGVLTLHDFPGGWATKARGSSLLTFEQRVIGSIGACKAYQSFFFAHGAKGAYAKSTTQFTDGIVAMENDVRAYPSVAQASQRLNVGTATISSGCFQQLYPKAVHAALASKREDTPLLRVRVAVQPTTNVGVELGDEQIAFPTTLTLSAPGHSMTIYLDQLLVRVGRALDSFSYVEQDGPVSNLVPSAVSASVARLQTALGQVQHA